MDYSKDGIVWLLCENISEKEGYIVEYANGLWVACSTYGSDDGYCYSDRVHI